jgi:hypothetical protein
VTGKVDEDAKREDRQGRVLRRAAALEYTAVAMDGVTRYVDSGPKETGALRRQSLELTRALAELRRP